MLILVTAWVTLPTSQMTALAQQDDSPVFPYITYNEIPQYWYLTNEVEGWHYEFVSYGPLDYQKLGESFPIKVQISVNGYQGRKEDYFYREDIVAFTQGMINGGSPGWDTRRFLGYDAYHIESITLNSASSHYSILLDRIDPSDWNNYYEVSYWIVVLYPNEDYDWKVARVNELLSQVKIIFPEVPGGANGKITGDKPEITPDQPEEPPDTDDNSWITVIGALAAGGGALAIAAKTMAARSKKKPKSDKDKKKEHEDEEAVGYILQISTDKLVVNEEQPSKLEATVWEVDSQGRYKRAQGAALAIEQPANTNFLHIAPRRAQGTLQSSVSLVGKVSVPSLQLTVTGSANGSSSSAQVTVEFASETYIEIQTDGKRRSLRADGKDELAIYARVVTESPDEEALKAAQDSLEFRLAGAGSQWAEKSERFPDGEWMCINMQAFNPDPLNPNSVPPGPVEVRVSAKYERQELNAKISINLLSLPVLMLSENSAAFLLGQAEISELRVWIDPPDEEEWEFDFQLEHSSVAADIHWEETDENQPAGEKKLVIIESGSLDDQKTTAPNGLYASDKLRIFAQLGETRIYNDVYLSIYQEGLYIDPFGRASDGLYHLKADGKKVPKEVDFRLLKWDFETRRLNADRDKPLELSFILLNEDEKTCNIMEVASLKDKSEGLRVSNLTSEKYHLWLENEIPSDGKTLRVHMLAQSEFESVEFNLGVETLNMPSYLPREELARCQHMINKHAPPSSRAKLQEILDKRAPVLDSEGLYQLRLQLWKIIQNIIQGEGGQGYHDEAVWADRIVTTLEWTQWAGDHCFNAVIAAKLGRSYVPYANFIKNVLIDCLNKCINEGKTLSEWSEGYYNQTWGQIMEIWENLGTIIAKRGEEAVKQRGWMWLRQSLENRRVEITFPGGKVVIPGWLVFKIFYSAGSFMNHINTGSSMYQAAKNTAWDVTDETIGQYIMDLGMKKGNQNIGKVLSDEFSGKDGKSIAGQRFNETWKDLKGAYKESGRTNEDTRRKLNELKKANEKFLQERKDRAAKSEQALRVMKGAKKEGGKLYADKKDVLDIMGDADKVRSLKNAPKEVQEAFENTRNKIYREHDAKLIRWARNNLPEAKGRKIVIDKFRTPGKGGSSFGTDNDYRLCYEVKVKAADGTMETMRIEIDQRKWDSESCRIFSEATGGPCDYAGAREWALSKQQLTTDQYNIEASPEFADQTKVYVDPKGNIVDDPQKWNKENPGEGNQLRVVNAQVRSNILNVKEGKTTLKDAEYLGKMYNVKVGDALHKGSKGDAYAQAKKSVETLREVRTGYARQGYKLEPLSDEMRVGMQAVEMAAENFDDPQALAMADQYLKDAKLGSLSEFVDKIASQYDSMKIATKQDSLKK